MKGNIISKILLAIVCVFCFAGCNPLYQDKGTGTEVSTEASTESTTESLTESLTELSTETITDNPTDHDDKFDCYEVVDNRLSELCKNEEFINATKEEKAEMGMSTLQELESEGFIAKNSIQIDTHSTIISFEYSNGAWGGFFLEKRNPEWN